MSGAIYWCQEHIPGPTGEGYVSQIIGEHTNERDKKKFIIRHTFYNNRKRKQIEKVGNVANTERILCTLHI